MKKIDSFGLKMCSYQATLFEASVKHTKSSSAIFIRRFMNSDLAKRMDNISFLFDSLEVSSAIDEVEAQYGASSYGSKKYSIEEMHWIGYIYRYWACISDKSSKQIYKMLKPDQLKKLFFPYHSLDPAQAIERIMEELEPAKEYDPSDIATGVAAMRKIRSKWNNRL